MIILIRIFLIKIFIKLTENIQALTNIDVYAILRIRKYNNLKLFLDNNFLNSFISWEKNNNFLEGDLITLHNISYNHWIRGNLALEIIKDNTIFKLSFSLGIIKNLISLLIFYVKIKFSKVSLNIDTIYINKNPKINNFKYNFVSSQKRSRFDNIANYLENNFYDSIKYQNINFNYKLQHIYSYTKDENKNKVLKSIFKYCLRFPFMAKYYKQMFQGFYIYNYFKKNAQEKNFFCLSPEIYSMETRSLSIASAKYKNATYVIKHNKFEALPYDMYSLNINKKPIFVENFLSAKKKKPFKIKEKYKGNSIVIQASDSCGSSISTYEFDSYVDIINVLEKLNYKGEIIFKFHPANINFFVKLKKDICLYYLKSKNIKIKFAHKNKDIESFASRCNFMISIDYSTSFLDILNMNIPIIYFNRNFNRHIINKSSQINNFSIYEMVYSKKDLEKKIINLL